MEFLLCLIARCASAHSLSTTWLKHLKTCTERSKALERAKRQKAKMEVATYNSDYDLQFNLKHASRQSKLKLINLIAECPHPKGFIPFPGGTTAETYCEKCGVKQLTVEDGDDESLVTRASSEEDNSSADSEESTNKVKRLKRELASLKKENEDLKFKQENP